MTRTWRPRPLVREQAKGGLWAGPLPDGPIVQLDEMAALLLETLLEATASADAYRRRSGAEGEARAVSAAEVLTLLDGVLEDVPDDAEATLEGFFAQLAASGLVEELDSSAQPVPDAATGPVA